MSKVILITGGSTGIGLALAHQLSELDYRIYAASRSGKFPLEKVSHPERIIPIKMDVNNDESVKNVIQQICEENITFDAVVCNAGNGMAGSIEDMTLDEVRYQMETNFFGAVRTIQACLPVFRSQNYGRIMVTTSVAGVVPIPYQTTYSASKAAMNTFVEGLSLEVKPYNIQCCCVLPGDTLTDFTSARKFSVNAEKETSPYRKRFTKSIGKMAKDEQTGMSPYVVSKSMVKQLTKKRMKLRVIPGLSYRLICWAFGWLPMRFKIWVVGLLYG